tara:strand:+ start:13260 stop:13469 length:210 start_codon:yes stop_codon:yes gene_type:complete
MKIKIKQAGNSLIFAGIFLLASRLASIIPVLDNWYPEDIVSAAKFSMVLAVVGFIILIIAGVNLVKSSK